MYSRDLVGQTLGHYRVIRSVGQGGTARVFLAEDLNLKREVALKVFWPGENEAHEFIQRFAREARVLAQLDHPHILPVYDYGEHEDTVYLVTPYMPGGSLRDRLRRVQVLPPSEAVALAAQALNALQYAHNHGLIHRDIKPGNMLFKANGSLVISDFGLVKIMTSNEQTPVDLKSDVTTTAQGIKGTPDYMAPEQILGRVAPASDLYAMGAVIYEMLCGSRLFSGENYISVLMKQINEQPEPLSRRNPHISPALEAVVMRSLAKEPEQRYPDAQALLNALTQAMADTLQAHPELLDYSTQPELEAYRNLMSSTQQVTLREQPREYVVPEASTRQAQSQINSLKRLEATSTLLSAQQTPSAVPQAVSRSPQGQVSSVTLTSRRKSPLLAIVSLMVLVVLIGSGGLLYMKGMLSFVHWPVAGLSPTSVSHHQVTPTSVAAPQIMQTSCPASAQTARAAISPFTSTIQADRVIYFTNTGSKDQPGTGSIWQYNPLNQDVAASTIATLPSTYLLSGMLSQDGQWLLFSVVTGNRYEIRLLRTDGQAMQTLYCSPDQQPITDLQWSFDTTQAIFNIGINAPITYLLNLTDGTVQPELVPQASYTYVPLFWRNNHLVYMAANLKGTPASAPEQNLYLLDTQHGANQHDADLEQLYNASLGCKSMDTSYDVKQIFMSTCGQAALSDNDASTGPSTITEQSSDSPFQTSQTIYSTQDAIVQVRSVTVTMLAFLVENGDNSAGQNGLWTINTDGTGAEQVMADANYSLRLCTFSQFEWSNFSHDGTMYVVSNFGADSTDHLYFGKFDGSTPFAPLDFPQGTNVAVVGWT